MLGVGVVLVVSCASEPVQEPDRDESPAQTDALVYPLERTAFDYEAWATVEYVNPGPEPVYFARCEHSSTGPMFDIVRAEPDTGWDFVGAAWACVGGVAPGVVAGQESLAFSVWLGSSRSPNADPPITMDERTGRFRIELQLLSAEGTSLPVQERRSNVFLITPPD